MKDFEERLRRQQAAFNRKLLRISIVLLAAVLILLGVLIFFSTRPPGGAPGDHIVIQDDDSGPVLTDVERDHPSQIVPRSVLYGVRDGNPLRITAGGKNTLIDRDILGVLLETVKGYSQEELNRRVDADIAWETFLEKRSRDRIRGRLCQFRGTLWRFVEVEDHDYRDIGIQKLYTGQVQDNRLHSYTFYCFEAPPEPIERTELAVLTGVFYKLVKYTNRAGQDRVDPLIVARTIERGVTVQAPRSVTHDIIESAPPWAVYVGLAAVIVAVFIAMSLLMRRKPASAHRVRGRTDKSGGTSAPTQSEGDGATPEREHSERDHA